MNWLKNISNFIKDNLIGSLFFLLVWSQLYVIFVYVISLYVQINDLLTVPFKLYQVPFSL